MTINNYLAVSWLEMQPETTGNVYAVLKKKKKEMEKKAFSIG